MKVVFAAARQMTKQVVYAEGESENVLRAVQVVIDEKLARPVLIGRPDKMRERIEKFGLRIRDGVNCEFVNIDSDPRYHETWIEYYRLTKRRGVSYEDAREEVRRRNTLVAAMLVHRGDADAMLCGTVGRYASHMRHITNVIGLRKGASTFAGMNVLTLPEHTVFICDTLVNPDPTPQQLAEITMLAVEQLRRFGDVPRVALLNHSSFGSSDAPSARKMREVMALLEARNPDFELEGEMQGDAAAFQSGARQGVPPLASQRPGQSAHHAEPGRRQHRLQPAQGDGRWRHHCRPDPARRRQAGTHPGPGMLGAAHRQHDSTCCGGRQRRALSLGNNGNPGKRLPGSITPITNKGKKMAHKKIYQSLYFQVIVAIVVGIALGHFFPETGASMKPLGDGFIKLIKMIIAPIIFCTIVVGIAGMENMKTVGKTGGYALLYFEVVSTIALLVGLMIVNLVQPGAGMNVDPASLDTKAIAQYTKPGQDEGHGRLPARHHPVQRRRCVRAG